MSPAQPLRVDVLVSGARISGVVDLVSEGRRLIDVLNDTGHNLFELTDVRLTATGATRPQQMPQLMVAKASVLMTIPRETQEQSRLRSLQHHVLGTQSTMQGWVTILLPGLSIEGLAHGPTGSARLPADPAVFAHFFLVTECRIAQPDGTFVELPVVAVNRDQVVGISLHQDAAKRIPA